VILAASWMRMAVVRVIVRLVIIYYISSRGR